MSAATASRMNATQSQTFIDQVRMGFALSVAVIVSVLPASGLIAQDAAGSCFF